jgi:retron-type reverse transcriptase
MCVYTYIRKQKTEDRNFLHLSRNFFETKLGFFDNINHSKIIFNIIVIVSDSLDSSSYHIIVSYVNDET